MVADVLIERKLQTFFDHRSVLSALLINVRVIRLANDLFSVRRIKTRAVGLFESFRMKLQCICGFDWETLRSCPS